MPSPIPEFTISRQYNADCARVFAAWTQVDQLKNWWGPKGFRWTSGTLDLKPGGLFHYGMKSQEGYEMWGKFVYREVVPSERLVFVTSFSDVNAGVTRHPLVATWPLEALSTITFKEEDSKTTLTLTSHPINASEAELATFTAGIPSMQQGFTGTLDQLNAYLED